MLHVSYSEVLISIEIRDATVQHKTLFFRSVSLIGNLYAVYISRNTDIFIP